MTSAPKESLTSQEPPVPDILSPAFAADPYGAYRIMRESAPLIRHDATNSYIISRYEDVERVFKDKAGEFTTDSYDWQIEPVHGRTILQLSGREHAVRRALVAPAFRGTDFQEKFLPGRRPVRVGSRYGQEGCPWTGGSCAASCTRRPSVRRTGRPASNVRPPPAPCSPRRRGPVGRPVSGR